MSELEINLSQNQQNDRNAIDISSKDGIELVSNGTVGKTEDIKEVRKEVIAPTKEVAAPVKEETVQPSVVLDPKKDENIENLSVAYKEYHEVVSQLPEGLLDNLNSSYMSLERSIAAIPKDILFKFTKSFESIDDDLPRIFLNPNDFGGSNYSFIVEKLKIYYDFSTTVPYQMISNLLTTYQEYSKYYKMIPINLFDYLVNSYREYKRCLSFVSPEVITSMGYDKVDSIFLNRVMLYEENMNFLLKDIDKEEVLSNVRYGITNDYHVKDGHYIIIPTISREDFINFVNQTGSLDRANEMCARNMEYVYNSIDRVKDTLGRDNAILNNMRANMEISTMFIGLQAKNKEVILKLIDNQISRRSDFIAKITDDLKNGWNNADTQVGIVVDDDDSDYFNRLERVTDCAKGYQAMFNDLMSLQQIINLIKQNGYNIK